MQFCKDCGGVLNLFGTNERELCSSCIQQKKKHQPPPPPAEHGHTELLADAVVAVKDNKIVLISKEGWQLWSGPLHPGTNLRTVLSQAHRIYEIRLRRQKN